MVEAGDKNGQVDSARGSVTGHHRNRLTMGTGRQPMAKRP